MIIIIMKWRIKENKKEEFHVRLGNYSLMYNNYSDTLGKPLRHVVRPLFCLGNNCIGIDTFCSMVERLSINFSHTYTPSWLTHPHADRVGYAMLPNSMVQLRYSS